MTPFLASLAHDDLASTTLRGYRYDLRHFLAWRCAIQDKPFAIEALAEYQLIAYRWHMVAAMPLTKREPDRLEKQNGRLREVTMDVLATAKELRQDTINRVMANSDLELGLAALRLNAPLTTRKPTLTVTLRAIRYRALLRGWAFRPQLAIRFRGLLRGGTTEKLEVWLTDARKCNIFGMRRFARTLRQDVEAVRNAVLEPWSNGQTEGLRSTD